MEEHKIDKIIKKAVDNASDFYDSEAGMAKPGVWEKVQNKQKKRTWPFILRGLAAACILLLICSTTVTILLLDTRRSIQQLAEVNTNLKKDIMIAKSIQPMVINTVDTVYKKEKVIVHQPVIQKKNITDTVYIQQLVYVEKEPAQTLAIEQNYEVTDSVFQITPLLHEKEILITTNKPVKQEKQAWIKFRFGRSRNEDIKEESERTLALTTRL